MMTWPYVYQTDASPWTQSDALTLPPGSLPPTPAVMPDPRPNYREKLKGKHLLGIGSKIAFLPYHDSVVGESAAMRAGYRQMLREPSIKAALQSKLLSVASLDVSVQPKGDKPLDRDAASFVDHCVQRVAGGMPGLVLTVALAGLIDGHSVSEKVWCVEDRDPWANRIIGKALKDKDPDTYRLLGDEYKNITHVEGTGHNSGCEWPIKDFVYWVHMPIYGNPTGMSDLRAAYRAYWVLDTAWKLRALRLEKHCGPFLIGKAPASSLDTLMEHLQEARAQTCMAITTDMEVQAINLAVSGDEDFRNSILDLRHEIFLGITGAFLQALEGAATGARSIGEVHESTAQLLVWYLSAAICRVLNDQWVPDLVEYNFPAGTAYPEIGLGGVNDADLVNSLAIDEGLQRMGLPLKRSEVYERYSRSEPDDPADTLDPPLPVAPPPMFADDGEDQPAASPFELASRFAGQIPANGHPPSPGLLN